MIGVTIVGTVVGATEDGAGGDDESTEAGPKHMNTRIEC